MKKFFSGLLAMLLSVSVWAGHVTQEDAALVANNFMNVERTTVSNTKKAPAKKMVLKNATTTTINQYYIYENANGEGWVMVAANDVAHPILAYSETGYFRADNQPDNVKVWLNGYNRQISRAEQNGLIASESIRQEWNALRNGARKVQAAVVVEPLVKTGWDQDAPFWNKCPQKSGSYCYTGCVATAMAQVMNYYQWPKQGTGSHSLTYNNKTYSANFGETTYDWNNMLNTYGNSATAAQKEAVATLMYHCGIAVDMQYGTADEGGSGAWTIDFNGYWAKQGTMSAETALTTFFGYDPNTIKGYYRDGDSESGMKSWTKAEWIEMLKVELDAARPIMYAGVGYDDPNDSSTGYGHSFICDGYDSNNLFHFNFGWTNWCDGYYDIDALETTDPGSGGGNGSYSLEQDVIVGIVPLKGIDIDVTWMCGGTIFDQTVAGNGVLTLPTNIPDACDNGKVFVGWSATEFDETDTKPTFAKTGDIITDNATYYAVYANQNGEGAAQSRIYLDKDSVSASYGTDSEVTRCGVTCYYTNVMKGTNGNIQMKKSGSYIANKTELTHIDSIVVNGVTSLTVYAGTSVKPEGTTITRNGNKYDFTSGNYSYFEIKNTTSGAVYPSNISIYYTKSTATYSGYTTSCGAPAMKYGITVNPSANGSIATSPADSVVAGRKVTIVATPAQWYELSTLTVKDADNGDVAVTGEGNVRSFIMPEKDVTISAAFAEQAKYTVRFINEGRVIDSQELYIGQAAAEPEDPTATCSDYTFAGWWTEELAADNTTAKSWVTNFNCTGAQDYYAIYSKTVHNGEMQLSNNYKKITDEADLTDGNYLIVAENNGYNAMSTSWKDTYYLAGKSVTPSSNIITTTDGTIIWNLTTDNNQVTISNATSGYLYIQKSTSGTKTYYNVKLGDDTDNNKFTYSVTDGDWLFTSVTYTNRVLEYYTTQTRWAFHTAADAPVYLFKQQEEEVATTFYSSSVTCATAISNEVETTVLKAQKVIENGQVVIIRGNDKYTIFGQKLQ